MGSAGGASATTGSAEGMTMASAGDSTTAVSVSVMAAGD